jgi:hypothetical protein
VVHTEIAALRRLRQEGLGSGASVGYMVTLSQKETPMGQARSVGQICASGPFRPTGKASDQVGPESELCIYLLVHHVSEPAILERPSSTENSEKEFVSPK